MQQASRRTCARRLEISSGLGSSRRRSLWPPSVGSSLRMYVVRPADDLVPGQRLVFGLKSAQVEPALIVDLHSFSEMRQRARAILDHKVVLTFTFLRLLNRKASSAPTCPPNILHGPRTLYHRHLSLCASAWTALRCLPGLRHRLRGRSAPTISRTTAARRSRKRPRRLQIRRDSWPGPSQVVTTLPIPLAGLAGSGRHGTGPGSRSSAGFAIR